MRTLEKMSTRLPLHSPLFLLGLFLRRLVEGRSKCCSRACLFCRMSPLAMAAAMAPTEFQSQKRSGCGGPVRPHALTHARTRSAQNSRRWMSVASPGHSLMAAAERVRSVWPNATVPEHRSSGTLVRFLMIDSIFENFSVGFFSPLCPDAT